MSAPSKWQAFVSRFAGSPPLGGRTGAAVFSEDVFRTIHGVIDVERKLLRSGTGFVEGRQGSPLDDGEVGTGEPLLTSSGERIGEEAGASGFDEGAEHLLRRSRFGEFLRHFLSPVIAG
jgi:hypothetical protein